MSEFGVAEWGALGGVAMALIALGGVIVWAMERMHKPETDAGAAIAAVTALDRKVERMETDLVNHRVASAREFVTHDVLAGLEQRLTADRHAFETRILAAIESLGKRIDKSLHGG